MQDFLQQHDICVVEGKIKLPEWVKRVKLDVGLCYNAPHAAAWVGKEPDLLVFGFEPHPNALEAIKLGGPKMAPFHGDPLDPRHLGKSVFVVPCALSQQEGRVQLHCTANSQHCNLGSSSLFQPSTFPVEKVVEVPSFRLDSFLALFPFDQCPLIEYIKIDAQGSDLDIVKSAGRYMADHVVVVTLEAETDQYIGTDNSIEAIEQYMRSINFLRVWRHRAPCDAHDPTYVNSRFIHLLPSIFYYQNG